MNGLAFSACTSPDLPATEAPLPSIWTCPERKRPRPGERGRIGNGYSCENRLRARDQPPSKKVCRTSRDQGWYGEGSGHSGNGGGGQGSRTRAAAPKQRHQGSGGTRGGSGHG